MLNPLILTLDYDNKESIFINLESRYDIYNFLLISKDFNIIKKSIYFELVKILFYMQNWFDIKFMKELEIIGIVLWSQQFLDTLNEEDINLIKLLYYNTNNNCNNVIDTKIINTNLHKIIISKRYIYRKTNKSYYISCYNIIDTCFHKILNII